MNAKQSIAKEGPCDPVSVDAATAEQASPWNGQSGRTTSAPPCAVRETCGIARDDLRRCVDGAIAPCTIRRPRAANINESQCVHGTTTHVRSCCAKRASGFACRRCIEANALESLIRGETHGIADISLRGGYFCWSSRVNIGDFDGREIVYGVDHGRGSGRIFL